MKLYEIDQAILDCVDQETGEIMDFERLAQLQMERTAKLEGIALYIKSLDAEAAAIKAEVAALRERQQAKENKAKSMKEWLTQQLCGESLETARVRLSWRSSTAVAIDVDENQLVNWLQKYHDDCLKYTAPTINKTELAKMLKAGEEIPGAMLETRQNLQIK